MGRANLRDSVHFRDRGTCATREHARPLIMVLPYYYKSYINNIIFGAIRYGAVYRMKIF